MRRVLVYVLGNYRKHEPRLRVGIDPYSSAVWFAGFYEPRPLPFAIGISEKTLDLERTPWRARGPDCSDEGGGKLDASRLATHRQPRCEERALEAFTHSGQNGGRHRPKST